MTNKEKIQCYKKKTIKELEEILNNPNSKESDIVIASLIYALVYDFFYFCDKM